MVFGSPPRVIRHSFPRTPAADFTSSVAAMRAVENKLHLRPARPARGRSDGLHTPRATISPGAWQSPIGVTASIPAACQSAASASSACCRLVVRQSRGNGNEDAHATRCSRRCIRRRARAPLPSTDANVVPGDDLHPQRPQALLDVPIFLRVGCPRSDHIVRRHIDRLRGRPRAALRPARCRCRTHRRRTAAPARRAMRPRIRSSGVNTRAESKPGIAAPLLRP